ncbi:TetR/AcrR family transcriptional regulator [Granulicella sp. dw_53]|uniref:TetR/AcrR family transcriptional regulator n=1 Tax=Granulicella sp. dw_53 TaxID=2719792 RepID=UPI001BD26D12|nr:TetR/AcrR family transcriptional regulator [Granulicella sp. dw_53]
MSDSKIISEPPAANSGKQRRTKKTRQELLRSARAIFAREGFEHARLEDIASKAGKTRGAFYANFKDKEDVFFAIFEENIDRDIEELNRLLLGLPTIEQRTQALADYLSKLSKDRERILLNLEFKLYAIRHPRKRKRLADLHGVMRLRSSMPELNRLIPLLREHSTKTKLTDSLVICAIVDGLSLNHLFDPEVLDNQVLTHYLNLFMREFLSGNSRGINKNEVVTLAK